MREREKKTNEENLRNTYQKNANTAKANAEYEEQQRVSNQVKADYWWNSYKVYKLEMAKKYEKYANEHAANRDKYYAEMNSWNSKVNTCNTNITNFNNNINNLTNTINNMTNLFNLSYKR